MKRLISILSLTACLISLAAGQEIKLKMAPEFTLPDIDGKNVTLSEVLGKGPVYISFWATWCKPCREELKIVEGIYEKYKGSGFRVLAINTEGARATAKIKSFVKSNGWTFDILLDNEGEVFRRKYKGFAMPFTIMTDPGGTIIFSSIGFKPGDETHIEDLIMKNLPAPVEEEKEDPNGENTGSEE